MTKNKEILKAATMRWRKKNKEAYNAYHKEYYHTHKFGNKTLNSNDNTSVDK